MRAVVQRVSEASVRIDKEVVAGIDQGLLVLVATTDGDGPAQATKLASKLWHLRIFADSADLMNKSCADLELPLLVVSQFTLYGDTSKGRRPSFVGAQNPKEAEQLIERLVGELRSLGAVVETGRFGANMAVGLVNDGPVTLIVNT